MNLFNYLMAKKGHNTSVRDDLLAYLLGKRTSQEVKTATGTTISISDVTSEKIVSLTLSKESTQDGTPTPENPVEVKTVKGTIDLKIVGKNLLPIGVGRTHNGITFTYNEDGSLNIDGTATSNAYINLFVNTSTNLISDTTKVYSFIKGIVNSNIYTNIFEYINGTATSVGSSSNNYGITYTPNQNAKGQIFRIQIPSGVTMNNVTIYPMIVEGDYTITGTNYEPYKESIITIPLNNNEIAGIGDYKDELIIDKNGHCWLNKKLPKYTLNGTTNKFAWKHPSITSETKGFYRADVPNKNTSFANGSLGIALCNYFNLVSGNAQTAFNNNESGMWWNKEGDSIYFILDKTSLAEANNWLTTHNTDIYYPLETSQLIDLNYTVDIRLFNGVNNISNSDDMDMTLKYY